MAACSTGSPASRRETKFTPFTTRPSFTSRQGITRSFSNLVSSVCPANCASAPSRRKYQFPSILEQRERVPGFDAPVIEGAADDDAVDPITAGIAQGCQVLEPRDAAGRDHWRRD